MNKKLVVPTILTATILVAGMFALTPVQKASTVHVAILAAITGGTGVESARAMDPLQLDTGGTTGIADVTAGIGATVSRIIMLYDGLGNARPADLEVNSDIVSNPPTETDADGDCVVTVEVQSEAALGAGWVDIGLAAFADTGTDHADATAQGLRLFVEAADAGGAAGCTIAFDSGQWVSVTVVGT